jgi:hypothetical protein
MQAAFADGIDALLNDNGEVYSCYVDSRLDSHSSV